MHTYTDVITIDDEEPLPQKQRYAMGTKVRMCFDSGKLYLEQYVGTIIKFDAGAEQQYTVQFEDGEKHVTNITGDPEVEVSFAGAWWQVCGSEYLGRRVRRPVYDENSDDIVDVANGEIVGWLPLEVSDFVSESSKKPAALWHVVYDSDPPGEEDLEESEVIDGIKWHSQDRSLAQVCLGCRSASYLCQVPFAIT
jgi:hypothetical protein